MSARDAGVLAGVFVTSTLFAELFGAENLGTAVTFGTIGLLLAILTLILRSA